MLKKHSQLFEGLFSASDIIVVSLAWVLSYHIRFGLELFPVEKGIPPLADYLKMLLFVWFIWIFVFRRFDLYRPMRGSSRLREFLKVMRANSLAVILLIAAVFLFREKTVKYSRGVFVIFFFFSTFLLVLSRASIRSLLRKLRRRGYNLRYAIIVGSGDLAAKVLDRINTHPEFGVECVGCLTNREQFNSSVISTRRFGTSSPLRLVGATAAAHALSQEELESDLSVPNMRVIGTYQDLPNYISQGNVDQVIVALPFSDNDEFPEVINSIGDSIVDVRIIPDIHQFIQLGSSIEEFDGLPIVSLSSTPLNGINLLVKRVFDLTVGSLILLLSLPIFLVTALLIKLTSSGPIFYAQERVGLDGRSFNIYKFRTMKADAEVKGAQFAVKNDPRVTKLGKFLRKYNIDELPQLLNVIFGKMSLVGPRPERPVFIEEFRKNFPKYMLRHKVQAGMTGWAQVNGWRGNTSIEKRIEHDLYYIENWSLMFDLKILVLTILNSFRDQNAY